MHVKAKKMAFCGLMLALSVMCMVLGSIIEINTLFLLAAASFFVGIVIRIFGKGTGVAFYLAGVLLGFILAPNKFYVITYASMSIYILAREFAWDWLAKLSLGVRQTKFYLWIIKYTVFNILYIPIVILFQSLLFTRQLSGWILFAIIVAGQVGLFIYDGAYEYVQRKSSKWIQQLGISGD